MRDSESVGLVTIIVGLVLVIGAIRGTWKKIFTDVIVDKGSSTPAPAQQTGPAQAGLAPNTANAAFVNPGQSNTGEFVSSSPPMTNGAPPDTVTVLS